MKYARSLLLVFASIFSGLAQEINVTVGISTTQSLSKLIDLQSLAESGQIYVTMQNLTQVRKEFSLEATMKSATTDFEIKTNPAFDIDFTLGASETKTLRYDDLEELFYSDSFVLQNGELATTYFENNLDGTIPSGTYQLCIQLKSKEPNIALSNILSNVGCSSLKFENYTAPIILSVNQLTNLNGGVLEANQNQQLIIQATPPVFSKGDFSVNNFSYNLKVFELPYGELPNTILDALIAGSEVRNYMVNKDLGSFTPANQHSFLIEQQDFANGASFEVGKQYAVFLQATSGVDILPNYGYSPAVWFYYGQDPDDVEDLDLELAGLPVECRNGNYNNIPLPTGMSTAVAQIANNEVIRVGCFYITAKDVSSSGGKFSGTGYTRLPNMEAKFLVSLNSLEVKSFDGKLVAVSGKAVGKIHEGFPPGGIVAGLYDSFLEAKGAILPAVNAGADAASQAASTVQGANRDAMGTANQTVNDLENLNLPPDIMAKIYEKQGTLQDASNQVSSITADVRQGAVLVKNGAEAISNTIEDAFDVLRTADRFVQQVSNPDFESGLPIGLDTQIEGKNLRMGVFGLLLTPTMAGVDLVVETPIIPGLNNRLYFGSNNVAISPVDFSFGNATFYLGGSLLTDIPGGHGLKLKGTGTDGAAARGTYLKLKDYDIDKLQISGDFIFSKDLFTPIAGSSNVIASVSTEFTDFDDFIINTDTNTEFRLTSNKNFKFKLENLSIDFSTTRNIEGNTNEPEWTGIYFKKIGMALPTDFADRPLSANISKFYLPFSDPNISFEADVNDILDISTGSLGGIGFAIQRLYVKVNNNNIDDIFLSGDLRIKMFDAKIPYKLPLEDIFKRNPENITGKLPAVKITLELPQDVELKIDAMHTSFTLGESSYITYNSGGHEVNGTLDASRKMQFMLHGRMSIQSEEDGLDLPSMTFNNFFFDGREIDKEQFHIGFASPQKYVGSASKDGTAGAFPINLTDFYPVFGLENGNIKFGLGFEVVVNLMEKAGFGAATKIEVSHNFRPDLTPVNGTFAFTFKKISIQTDVSVAKISGELEFLKDDTWGNGFRGCIRLELTKPAPIVAQVQGIFGSKGTGNNTYRYFFVEGMVKGINAVIPATTLALDGFAGGLWYNMEKTAGGISTAARLNGNQTGCIAPNLSLKSGEMGVNFGVLFKEAASQGFAFNGMMIFEASLTTDFEPITFEVSGAGNFIKMPSLAISSIAENRDNIKIAADIRITYDFTQNVLSGEFNVFLNINDVLRGGNGRDNAGRLVMYFGNNDWYIYLGNPWGRGGDPGGLLNGSEEQKYASVIVELPSRIGQITSGAYICMGTWGISGLPPLPSPERLAIPRGLRNDLESFRPQLDPRVSNGGLAFGAYIGFNFPIDFSILKGYLNAGFGFDLALIQYGNNVECKDGREIEGINGAYAIGQVYGYAECGLDVVIPGYDPYNLAQADVSLQATFGGPNPYWLDGKIKLSKATLVTAVDAVLGVATGGASTVANAIGEGWDSLWGDDPVTSYTEDFINMFFPNGLYVPISLGNPCIPDPTNADRLADKSGVYSIISHINPGIIENSQRKMSVNSAIEVHFNRHITQYWETYFEGRIQLRKWEIKEIVLKNGNNTINHRKLDGPKHFKVFLNTNVNIGSTITMTLTFQLQKYEDRQWKWMRTYADGSSTNEVHTASFLITADTPEIQASQVVETFPVLFQENFLQGSSLDRPINMAYIKLNLKKDDIKRAVNRKVKFFANGAFHSESVFEYFEANREGLIKYTMPTLPLNAEIRTEFWIGINSMEFNREKENISGKSNLNSTSINQQRVEISQISTKTVQSNSNKGGSTSINDIINPMIVVKSDSLEVYQLTFRTSKYKTFAEKMASSQPPSFRHEADNYEMTTYFDNEEDFSAFEIEKQVRMQNYVLTTPWHITNRPIIESSLGSMRFDNRTEGNYAVRYLDQLYPEFNFYNGNLKVNFRANQHLMFKANMLNLNIPNPDAGDYPIAFDYYAPFCDNEGNVEFRKPSIQKANEFKETSSTSSSTKRSDIINSTQNTTISMQSAVSASYELVSQYDYSKTIHYLGYDETLRQQLLAATVNTNVLYGFQTTMPLIISNYLIVNPNGN